MTFKMELKKQESKKMNKIIFKTHLLSYRSVRSLTFLLKQTWLFLFPQKANKGAVQTADAQAGLHLWYLHKKLSLWDKTGKAVAQW